MYIEQVYNALGATVERSIEIAANSTAAGYAVLWAAGQKQLPEFPVFHDSEWSIGLCKPVWALKPLAFRKMQHYREHTRIRAPCVHSATP